jgi:hypothetical protein
MTDQDPAELEARIDELERRLKRSDPRATIETAFWALMHNVLPDETRVHMKAVGRKQLIAARTYLDRWIARMDETPAEEAPARETIEVE